jgi:hypothetical protein
MQSPGYKSLGAFSITTAGTFTGDWNDDFEGCLSALINLRFIYGANGTSVVAYVQTSADDGTTPIDVAAVAFGVASENAVFNFSALTPKTTQVTPSDGALASDTTVDGIVGDRYRVKIVVVGTYSGSTQLVCSAVAR